MQPRRPFTKSVAAMAAVTGLALSAPVLSEDRSFLCKQNPKECHRLMKGVARLVAQQHALLSAHNKVRAKHCVPALTWSQSLAQKAQAWARGCKMDGSVFVHSDHAGEGENLAWWWPQGSQQPAAAVDIWYNEISKYDFNNPGYNQSTGHFTQVIWRGSTQIGCAIASCGQYDYVVCRYAPAGNITNPGQFAANVPKACT